MIRSDKILTAFFGGVGWRQPTLAGMPTLDSDNLGSTSGQYFDDAHPIVTVQSIYDCQDDKDITDGEFNTFLSNMQKAAILEVMYKVLLKESDFISSQDLYPFEKTFSSTLEPSSKAIMFCIEPKTLGNSKILEIPWIELSFDTEKTFNVYLYNSNLPKSPIKTESVTTTSGQSKIVDLNWYISDDTTHKGGKYYLGYFEDDLDGAKAYKKDYELSNLQVDASCYYVNPVSLDHTGIVIDVSSDTNLSDTNGLNFGMNVYNDYTELLIRNKSLFWSAIKYQMIEKVANLITASTRTNATERVNLAKLQLFGATEIGVKPIDDRINRAVKDLKSTLFYRRKIWKGTIK